MADESNSKTKAKAEVETVQMSDGRKVDFAGKRKLIKDDFIENGRPGVILDFRNGETRKFYAHENLVLKAAGHGLKQKYGDETAGLQDIDDMILAVDELDGTLQKGVWSEARESGGMAGTSVLLRALVEFSGKTTDQVREFLTGKSQAEKMALRNSGKLKPIVDRIEADKIAKSSKVDADALDAELAAFA